MVTVVAASTALVLTVNVALVAPAATVTLDGTLAAVLLLESAPTAPQDGAAPLSVAVAVEEFPPTTLVGFSVSEERATDAGATGEDSSKSRIAGLGSFSESTTNFEAEIM